MKGYLIRLLSVLLVLGCVLVSIPEHGDATCLYGIYNNGAYGLTIDINSAPYTTFAGYSYGQYAYTGSGCAWFASARVRQLTGKGSTIWAGSAWYNSRGASLGFSTGTTFSTTSRALACYANHVTVVEGLDSNGNVIISEGGYNSSGYANYGYCRIATMSRSTLESSRGGSFLGYVYLGVSMINTTPTPVTVTYSDDTEDQPRKTIGTTTATMAATIHVSGASINDVNPVGFSLYNANGTLLKSKTEKPTPKNGVINAWYTIGSGQEIDYALTSGTTYLYRFQATVNGTTYYGDYKRFTTNPIYVTSVGLSPSTLTLNVGGSSTVTANVSPSNASIKAVNWSSSNEDVATVVNGRVTAVSPGTATIRATASDGSGKYGTCAVTVNPILVTSVSLSSSSLNLTVGGSSSTLTATVLPSDATNKTLTWTSSDSTVATVSNGTVYPKKAGTTTITASATDGSGKKATCTVNVYELTLNAESITLADSGIGSTFQLEVVVNPSNTSFNITYFSSNTQVASVSSTGLITAASQGTTTIYATVPNIVQIPVSVTVTDMGLITLPASLESVEDEAFRGNTMKRVVIPNGVKRIGSYAFADNTSLLYVVIPSSVSEISFTAFSGSPNVCILCPENSYAALWAEHEDIEYSIIEN